MRPCDLKATRCQIEGTTRLAYHVGVRNPALVEGKLPGLPAKIPDSRDRCTGTIVGQAAARLFDEECRNAFVRLRRVHGLGPRQYENGNETGRAHVRTPATNAHLLCRLLPAKQTKHK